MCNVQDYIFIYNNDARLFMHEEWHFIQMWKTINGRQKGVCSHKPSLSPVLVIRVHAPTNDSARLCK